MAKQKPVNMEDLKRQILAHLNHIAKPPDSYNDDEDERNRYKLKQQISCGGLLITAEQEVARLGEDWATWLATNFPGWLTTERETVYKMLWNRRKDIWSMIPPVESLDDVQHRLDPPLAPGLGKPPTPAPKEAPKEAKVVKPKEEPTTTTTTAAPAPAAAEKPGKASPAKLQLAELLGKLQKALKELMTSRRKDLKQARQMGEWLMAAKSLVKGRGSKYRWERWLEDNLPDLGERSAQVYMRLAKGKDAIDKMSPPPTSIEEALAGLRKPRVEKTAVTAVLLTEEEIAKDLVADGVDPTTAARMAASQVRKQAEKIAEADWLALKTQRIILRREFTNEFIQRAGDPDLVNLLISLRDMLATSKVEFRWWEDLQDEKKRMEADTADAKERGEPEREATKEDEDELAGGRQDAGEVEDGA